MKLALKILKDRKNQLQSQLADVTRVKLTKIIDVHKATQIENQIHEVDWLINKFNKLNNSVQSAQHSDNTVTTTFNQPFEYTLKK